MSTSKLPKRTVLETIIAAVDAGDLYLDSYEASSDDIKAYAINEIELLDKRAAKAKERAAVKKAEGDELTEVVYEAMSDEFEPIADVLARIEGDDLSAAKVSARMRKLVEAGRAEKGEIKVKPEGGKTRTLVAYRKL